MKKSILIIEWEDKERRLATVALSSKGYHVVAVRTMGQGVFLLREWVFDAILLDIQGLDADGLEGLNALRRMQPESFLIGITDAPGARAGRELLKEGHYDILVRPFFPNDLVRIVERTGHTLPEADHGGVSLPGCKPSEKFCSTHS